MYIRSRRSFRLNSMLPLAVLVCVGVVVTTIAQAGEPGAAPAKLLVNVDQASHDVVAEAPQRLSERSWLLPNGVVSSFSRGMYHMQLNNARVAHGASLARNLTVTLSVGYSDDDRPVAVPAAALSAGRKGLRANRDASPAMFMSVGSQW